MTRSLIAAGLLVGALGIALQVKVIADCGFGKALILGKGVLWYWLAGYCS